MACFDACGCTCYQVDAEFDRIVAAETRFGASLRQILDLHAGWYTDRAEGGSRDEIALLGLAKVAGVYILWQQVDYCAVHDAEHLHAQYVGKAGTDVAARLVFHYMNKRVGAGLTTEISVWPARNRQAKYIEQLLLDLYDFPLNSSENPGSIPLSHSIAPGAWN